MTRLLCVVSLVIACSGKPGAPAHPDRPLGSGSTLEAGSDRQVQTNPPDVSSNDRNCDKLIDHLVTLAVAERPADQKPTNDERTNIATQLRTNWKSKCEQMTSGGYNCALGANTLAALDRCGG